MMVKIAGQLFIVVNVTTGVESDAVFGLLAVSGSLHVSEVVESHRAVSRGHQFVGISGKHSLYYSTCLINFSVRPEFSHHSKHFTKTKYKPLNKDLSPEQKFRNFCISRVSRN